MPGTFDWRDKTYHNTCYALKNGHTIFKRDKHKPPFGAFKFSGLRIGIEICAENGVLYQNGVNDLDVMLLVSAGIIWPDLSPVRTGRYGLAVDGASGVYTLMRKTGANSEPHIQTNL